MRILLRFFHRLTSRFGALSLAAAAVILAFGLIAYPSPVRDAVTLRFVHGFALRPEPIHLFLTPITTVSDTLTILGEKELIWFAIWFVAAVVFAPTLGERALAVLLLGLVAVVALDPQGPSCRLVAKDPNVVLVDFHSHTAYSHDGRPIFTPGLNRRWHWHQGFNAGFITDHNTIFGAKRGVAESVRDWRNTGYRCLLGEEVSLYHTHIDVIGNGSFFFKRRFDGQEDSIRKVVDEAHRQEALAIAASPEYWKYHWDAATDQQFNETRPDARATVDQMVSWGIDGFEIVNGATKALDFRPSQRRRIVDLCRAKNLIVTGATDNHGWGRVTPCWNALTIPGWRAMDPPTLQAAIMTDLRTRRFAAVRVLERLRYSPRNGLEDALCPLGILWVYLRSLDWAQRLVWIVWIALFYLAGRWLDHYPRGRTSSSENGGQ